MTRHDGLEPEPLLIPEREEWVAACPVCGELAFGPSPQAAVEGWRDHHHDQHPQTVWTGRHTSWNATQLQQELGRFEHEARQAGMPEETIRSHLDHTQQFIRWLAGYFRFNDHP